MAGKISVPLIEPLETAGGLVSEAVFREPRGRDVMALGQPFQAASVNGGFVVVEKDEVIQAYMERCVEAPLNPVLLGGMGLADALNCREKFLGFFEQARAMISERSSTSSSST